MYPLLRATKRLPSNFVLLGSWEFVYHHFEVVRPPTTPRQGTKILPFSYDEPHCRLMPFDDSEEDLT